MKKSDLIEQYALDQVRGPYIYGATGQTCTPSYRKARAAQYPEYADKIREYCPVLSGEQTTCDGCMYEGRKAHDCAQLTRKAAEAAGLSLPSGASSQWNKGDWLEKGAIKDAPTGKVLFLYRRTNSGNPMGHTGICLRDGRVVDARGHKDGTKRTDSISDYPWTDYAILRGSDDSVAAPINPRPTLRNGSQGEAVIRLQAQLVSHGYDIAIDGKYGSNTLAAVKAFQGASGLDVDGIVGAKTWAALDALPSVETPPEDPPDESSEWDNLSLEARVENLNERLLELEGRDTIE